MVLDSYFCRQSGAGMVRALSGILEIKGQHQSDHQWSPFPVALGQQILKRNQETRKQTPHSLSVMDELITDFCCHKIMTYFSSAMQISNECLPLADLIEHCWPTSLLNTISESLTMRYKEVYKIFLSNNNQYLA